MLKFHVSWFQSSATVAYAENSCYAAAEVTKSLVQVRETHP
jgi:hypothetical protein